MLDDKLTGHNKHCPKCDNHLTSLYLCPECGVRYDEWYKADQRIAELDEEKAMEAYRYVELASVNDRLEKRIAELERQIEGLRSMREGVE